MAALGSYLHIRSWGGEWHVRIDDLDPPREQPGAADSILRALEACALQWDGPVVYQSTRGESYQEALDQLLHSGKAYPCACTRREIASAARQGASGPIYPGFCRDGLPAGRRERTLRVYTDGSVISFTDVAAGRIDCELQVEVGDFVVRRADGLPAYHLACVVDDATDGFTHIIRGCDLLSCTPAQIHLQYLLNLSIPEYYHLPLVCNDKGQKLSKQTQAAPLAIDNPAPAMIAALQVLGYAPPADLGRGDAGEIIAWAGDNS